MDFIKAFFASLFRYKHNVTIREINQAVVKSILVTALEDQDLSKQAMVQNLEKVRCFINDNFEATKNKK